MATSTTAPSTGWRPRANRVKRCSSSSPSRTWCAPPISSAPATTVLAAWTAGHRWRSVRSLPTIPPAPERRVWARTGPRAPGAADTRYVEALAAPDPINAVPERALAAFADHGRVEGGLPLDGGDADAVLADFTRIGVGSTALAAQLQREGTASFDRSWKDLLDCLAAKRAMLAQRNRAAAGRP